MSDGAEIYLGTVNIEPNRHGMAKSGGEPLTTVSAWLPEIEQAGFDGLELWERHARSVSDDELAALDASPVPVRVFNSYASWDPADDELRDQAAGWVKRLGAIGVKYNVGADPALEHEFVARLQRFDAVVPDAARLLCECHPGTIAEEPPVARRMFDAVAGPERCQAIVHLRREPDDRLQGQLDVLADRVSHVHVQLQPVDHGVSPEELADELAAGVTLIQAADAPVETWTIEFSHGVHGWANRERAEPDDPGFILQSAARDVTALRLALGVER